MLQRFPIKTKNSSSSLLLNTDVLQLYRSYSKAKELRLRYFPHYLVLLLCYIKKMKLGWVSKLSFLFLSSTLLFSVLVWCLDMVAVSEKQV